MPIYAYQCGQCDFRKDVLQKVSDAALTVCPQCGAAAFQKQLSAPSFQLKGTGWYATDFKNSAKPAAAPAAKADSSGGGDASAKESAATQADGTASGAKQKTKAADASAA